MAKCTVEPKLDFDKFTEACERFKKICEREMEMEKMWNDSNWILTKDKMPEDSECVLITIPEGTETNVGFATENCTVLAWWYEEDGRFWSTWDGSELQKEDVPAWQPLPAPYKGE